MSDHISHIEHLIYQQQYINLSIVCLFTTCLYYACHSIRVGLKFFIRHLSLIKLQFDRFSLRFSTWCPYLERQKNCLQCLCSRICGAADKASVYGCLLLCWCIEYYIPSNDLKQGVTDCNSHKFVLYLKCCARTSTNSMGLVLQVQFIQYTGFINYQF